MEPAFIVLAADPLLNNLRKIKSQNKKINISERKSYQELHYSSTSIKTFHAIPALIRV